MMNATTDLNPMAARAKAMWMKGDYAGFAKFLEPGALQILAGWSILPGSSLLDIACGAGQISIPAARTGVIVTGVDIAANLIQQGRIRAEAEGLSIQFDEGDAEQLPYPDASFDMVVSMLGAMFAPHPDRVASEMTRVCRPGGRIIMVNFTSVGLVADTFRLFARYAPPPPKVPSPFLWGHEQTVRDRLSNGIADLQITRGTYSFSFPFSIPDFVVFSIQNNPVWNHTFAALDELNQDRLLRETIELHAKYNLATDETAAFEQEYLQVVALRSR